MVIKRFETEKSKIGAGALLIRVWCNETHITTKISSTNCSCLFAGGYSAGRVTFAIGRLYSLAELGYNANEMMSMIVNRRVLTVTPRFALPSGLSRMASGSYGSNAQVESGGVGILGTNKSTHSCQ